MSMVTALSGQTCKTLLKACRSRIVHFEGHRDDIQQQMLSLDLLVMPSDHEGLPMTLLEAMVLHTPIVAHAVGGIPNLLDEWQLRPADREPYSSGIQ